MENTAEKLNSDSLALGYIRCPYALARKGLPGKIERVASVIYSFSVKKKDPDAECILTREGFGKWADTSPSTVSRAIMQLDAMDGFEKRDENGRRHYKLHIPAQGGYIKRYRFLFTHKFMLDGVERTLTPAEEKVFSLFLTNATNKNAKKGFECSAQSIAEMLGLSQSTVEHAIELLLRADLIHRPRRGTSRHRRSRYTVCRDLRLLAPKAEKQEQVEQGAQNAPGTPKAPRDARTVADVNADARTERERHFTHIHNHAIAIADANREQAERNADYVNVRRKIGGIEIMMARAEVDGDKERLEDLKRQRKSLLVQRARVLARIGLTERNLHPQWQCSVCEDTGFRKSNGHMCNCWRPPKGAQP